MRQETKPRQQEARPIRQAIKPRQSLGQHWLSDDKELDLICAKAEIATTDTVLEIGPGTGALTKKLAARAGTVVAVELDELLATELPYRVPDENLIVISQDILRFDFGQLPPNYKIVANIPYYLTSHLIRIISEAVNPPSMAVLLVQKEVAARVSSRPGAMSLLGVSTQFYWQTSLGAIVDAYKFTPPPKVDSQILVLTRRKKPLFVNVDEKHFFRIVRAGFASRRKTLQNSLAGGLRLNKPKTAEILNSAGIKSSSRPQELSLEDWHRIYQTVMACNMG